MRLFLVAIGMWFIAVPWPTDNSVTCGFWTLFTSYFLLTETSCFHEMAHQTACKSRQACVILGRFIGTVLLVPYTVYRESHIRHHAYLNQPADWELWPYSDPDSPLWFRRAFVWVDLLFGAIAAPYTYGRIFFHKDSPLTSSRVRRTICLEYGLIVLFWGIVLSLIGVYGAWREFLAVWCVPHWLAGIWQTGRKFTEHLGMRSFDPLKGTRTVVGKSVVTRASSALNFDIFVHGVHHKHPRIPHSELESRLQQHREANPQMSYPVFPSYWQAVVDMLPWMFRNPGVGRNVGGRLADSKRDESDRIADDRKAAA